MLYYSLLSRKKQGGFSYAALPNVQYLMDFNTLSAADGAGITSFTEQKSSMTLTQRITNASSQLYTGIVRHNAINGKKALEFDGTQSFQFPTSFNSILNQKTGATFFQVVKYTLNAGTDLNSFFISMPNSAGAARFSMAHRNGPPLGPAAGGRRGDSDGYAGAAPGFYLTKNEFIVMAGKTDLATGQAKVWLNNSKYTNINWQSTSSAVTAFPNTSSLHSNVGANAITGTPSGGMKGQIAFQMFCDAPWSDASIESVMSQLSTDYTIPLGEAFSRDGTLHGAFALGTASSFTINGVPFTGRTTGFGYSWEQGTTTGDPTTTGDLLTMTQTWAREKNSFTSPIFISGATSGHSYDMWFHVILQPNFNSTVVIRPHETSSAEYSFPLTNSGAANKYVLIGPCRFTKPTTDANGDLTPRNNGSAGGNFRICGVEVWRVG